MEQPIHSEPNQTPDGVTLYQWIAYYQAGELSFDDFCDQLNKWDKESRAANNAIEPLRGEHKHRLTA